MRIGLISINMYVSKLNFACPLHTYAFQQFLLSKGIESTIINYKPVYFNDFDMEHPFFYYSAKYDRLIEKGDESPKAEAKRDYVRKMRDAYGSMVKEREVRYEKFQHFIDTHYIKTDACYDSDLLEISDPGFDCYICVTDVIWKYEPGEGFDRGFFLASKAMEGKAKIAYAASRGVPPTYTPKQEAKFLYYIDDFDSISVREKSLQHYINTHTNKNAELVLDPVLLNQRDLYDAIAIKPKEDHYVLLYYVMEKATDTIQMAVDYARDNGLKIVELTDFPDSTRLDNFKDVEKIYRYDVGPEEWLGYIREAECVFTNSFHGTCFSILFKKKFYAGKRNGDKVTHLLEETGLTSRRASCYEEIKDAKDPEIDYSSVNLRLETLRKHSADFIVKAIRNAETKREREREREECSAENKYDWWKRNQRYKVVYCSGNEPNVSAAGYADENGSVINSSESSYFLSNASYQNTGYYHFEPCKFSKRGKRFSGWTIKIKIDKHWFYYHQTGTLVPETNLKDESTLKIFSNCDSIPFLPINHIAKIIATAKWEDGIGEDEKNPFPMVYHSGGIPDSVNKSTFIESIGYGSFIALPSGNIEYRSSRELLNTGTEQLIPCGYIRKNHVFSGWRLRLRIGEKWFWVLENGSLIPKAEGAYKASVFAAESCIPYIPVNKISSMVAEAVWESSSYTVHFNSGITSLKGKSCFSKNTGATKLLKSGSMEYTPKSLFENTGEEQLPPNRFEYRGKKFVGWRVRIKERGIWYWLLEDGSFIPQKSYSKDRDGERMLLKDQTVIPKFTAHDVATAVFEASWEE